ncbi:hypothetical protein FGG08_002719 [Glutinoglossum americanum]|uniref:Uncharacterized protein n=1 Tax=Glutinoglossum americanum TaxID=1670608 RepID=A0A9P8KYX6_9PEZI|nr:hypothetical protein FGG08_002719 [Glutinoglossum americanum]
MSWLGYLRRLYSLDTLDTRFTTSSTIPPRPLTSQREDGSKPGDSAGRGVKAAGDGASPSLWGTPEFYVYYAVFAICIPLMFKTVIEVSQESHPNYPKYSHLLSPGWVPGRKVDNSDAQYSTFRENIPHLFLALILHPLLRRLYELCTSGSNLGHDPLVRGSGQANDYDSPTEVSDARLNQRISFDFAFAFLLISALHGVSAFKILLILYINYNLATRLPMKYIPVATWTFNIGILFANELCKGYRFATVAEFLLPWSAASEKEGAKSNWGAWLDSYGGLIPRWEILFNITVLRLVSFNLDYYWSLSMRSNSAIEKKQLDPANLSERDRISSPAQPHLYSLRSYIAYALYAPLYLAGPILTFNDYIYQLRYPAPSITAQRTLLYGIRLLITLLSMELILHYIYVVAISNSHPDWTVYTPFQLSMLGYFNLHIIWLKLLLPWRFFRFWSLIDGVDPPENMVRCMSDNYSALAFWRGWHRSFNRWIVRYIYIPLGGSGGTGMRGPWGTIRTVVNYLAVFTFVALWHDINLRLLMWGWLITLFVLPEVIATFLFPKRKWIKRKNAYRVLCGIGAVGNILMMMAANLVGFAVGLDGLKGLVNGITGSYSGLVFLAVASMALFVGAQVMFEVREHEMRQGIRRPPMDEVFPVDDIKFICSTAQKKIPILSKTLTRIFSGRGSESLIVDFEDQIFSNLTAMITSPGVVSPPQCHRERNVPQETRDLAAMNNLLSPIASAASPVDLSLRLTQEIFAFLSALTNAPAELTALHCLISELSKLFSQVQILRQSYQSSSLLVSNQAAFDSIDGHLECCTEDLKLLQKILSAPVTTTDTTFNRFSKKIKLVLNEKEIAKILLRLESRKTLLSTALSIVGRCNDIETHGRLQSISDKLDTCRTSLEAHAATAQPQALVARRLEDLHAEVVQVASHVENRFSVLDRNQVAIGKDFAQFAVDIRRKLTRVDEVLLSLNDLHVSVIQKSNANTAIIIGSAVKAAASLSAVYPYLHYVISQTTKAAVAPLLTPDDIQWLEHEFKTLLADVSESAAKELRIQQIDRTFRGLRRPTQPTAQQREYLLKEKLCNSGPRSKSKKRKLSMLQESAVNIDLPMGRLVVFFSEEAWDHGSQNSGRIMNGVRLVFYPHRGLYISGFAAASLRYLGGDFKIAPSISTFGVHPCDSPVFGFIECGNLAAIRELLRKFQVSSNDRDENGNSLLWYALSSYNFNVCRLLLDEGADPFDCNSNGDTALACFIYAFQGQSEQPCPNEIDIMTGTRLFIGYTGADSVSMAHHFNSMGQDNGEHPLGILHTILSTLPESLSDTHIYQPLKLLLLDGCDPEQKDGFGRTPLLSCIENVCRGALPAVVDMLLKAGADPLTTGNGDEGMLHSLLRSLSACNDESMEPAEVKSITNVIVTLLRAGCDPNLLDEFSDTPSDKALSPVAWVLWCDALRLAGMDIESVLLEDDSYHSTPQSQASLKRKFGKAVASTFTFDSWIDEPSSDYFGSNPGACGLCGRHTKWQRRRQPFDCFGSYLIQIGDGPGHAVFANHRDGGPCGSPFVWDSCDHRDHRGRDWSRHEISWRKHVAHWLWRDGTLNSPLAAYRWATGISD